MIQKWGVYSIDGKVHWTKIPYTDCSRIEVEGTEITEGIVGWMGMYSSYVLQLLRNQMNLKSQGIFMISNKFKQNNSFVSMSE